MLLRKKEITITVTEVQIGESWFGFNTVEELLEGLEETDRMFNRIVINDSALAKALESLNVVWRHNKGSYARGDEYDKFVKEFRAASH